MWIFKRIYGFPVKNKIFTLCVYGSCSCFRKQPINSMKSRWPSNQSGPRRTQTHYVSVTEEKKNVCNDVGWAERMFLNLTAFGSTHRQRRWHIKQAHSKFKHFIPRTNQRLASTMSLRNCPISVARSLLLVLAWKYCCCCCKLRIVSGGRRTYTQSASEPLGQKVQVSVESSFLISFLLYRLRLKGYVSKYGGTQASSNDQPVCFDGRLRRGSGEAASSSGPLAVWG